MAKWYLGTNGQWPNIAVIVVVGVAAAAFVYSKFDWLNAPCIMGDIQSKNKNNGGINDRDWIGGYRKEDTIVGSVINVNVLWGTAIINLFGKTLRRRWPFLSYRKEMILCTNIVGNTFPNIIKVIGWWWYAPNSVRAFFQPPSSRIAETSVFQMSTADDPISCACSCYYCRYKS